MEAFFCRLKCIVICFLTLFAVGCNAAGCSDTELEEVEENLMDVSDKLPKEESEKSIENPEEEKRETELEKEELDVNGLIETVEQAVEEVKQDRTQQIENIYENDGKYSSFLKKAWTVDGPKRVYGGFEFIITGISDEAIEGYIVISDHIEWLYWSNSEIGRETCKPFNGTITGNKAECVFQYEECQVEATFLFQENDRIEAAIRCDELDINEGYQFRPSNLSDYQLRDDVSSTPVFLETWGEVNLVSATTDYNHSVPYFFITDDEGNILYRESCMQGLVFWDVFVEDLDQDGRLDIWTVTGGDHSPECGRIVDIFYQAENGHFYRERERIDEVPKEYYGEYRVVQFCPSEDYAKISEMVLTQQEAEQMLGKDIVIQDQLFVTYDSERRTGTRADRELPTKDSMITEYRYPGPVSPDLLLREAHPDERLREAVGEEYYEKINGVFSNIYVGWQQFYTLEGEEKLIMHSMLTGQNFILERKK